MPDGLHTFDVQVHQLTGGKTATAVGDVFTDAVASWECLDGEASAHDLYLALDGRSGLQEGSNGGNLEVSIWRTCSPNREHWYVIVAGEVEDIGLVSAVAAGHPNTITYDLPEDVAWHFVTRRFQQVAALYCSGETASHKHYPNGAVMWTDGTLEVRRADPDG